MMLTNTPGNYCSLSGEFALLMISERSDKRIDYNCAADSVNSGVKGREELIVFHFIRKCKILQKTLTAMSGLDRFCKVCEFTASKIRPLFLPLPE